MIDHQHHMGVSHGRPELGHRDWRHWRRLLFWAERSATKKLANQQGEIGLGPYLLVVGVTIMIAGGVLLWLDGNPAISWRSAGWTAGFAYCGLWVQPVWQLPSAALAGTSVSWFPCTMPTPWWQ